MPEGSDQKPTQERTGEGIQSATKLQLTGRLDWPEIDIVRSNFDTIVDGSYWFDGDLERAVPYPALGAVGTLNIYLKKPVVLGTQQLFTDTPANFVAAGVFVFIDVAGVGHGPVALPVVADPDRVYIPAPNTVLPIREIQITPTALDVNVSQYIVNTCMCVSATMSGIFIDNTPDKPVFVQAQQQLVNEEVEIVTALTGTPENIFDKNYATFIVGTGVTTITLTHPKLLSRIALQGDLVDVDVDVTLIDGTVLNKGAAITDGEGWDSGNFDPLMVTVIVITAGGPGDTTLREVVALKVIEVKGSFSANVSNTPADPFFVEAPQAMVIEEINAGESIVVGSTAGVFANLFDKNLSTGMDFAGAAAGEGVTVIFNAPQLISRVAFASDLAHAGVRRDVYVDVLDVEGGWHRVFDGSDIAAASLAFGLDSGNFNQQAKLGGDVPVIPTSPIMATQIKIQTILVPGVPVPWNIDEIVILKTIETKAYAYNEPAEPLFTQDDQHICDEEIWWPNVSGDVDDITAGNLRNLFDKNPDTSVTITGAVGDTTIRLPFNTSHLISRLSVLGSVVGAVEIQLIGVDNTATLYPLPDGMESGWDSLNFNPHSVIAIQIWVEEAAVLTLSDMTLYKPFETKIANGAEAPAQVQAQQIVSWDEVAFVDLTGTTMTGDAYSLFDHDFRTGAGIYDANGDGVIMIALKTAMLISRIALLTQFGPVGNNFMFEPIIEVQDVNGTWITVLRYSTSTTEWQGVDTGNFKDNRIELPPDRGVEQASPIEVTAIRISSNGGGFSRYGEIIIHKTIETKDYIYNEPKEPVFVQDERQVVTDEVSLEGSGFATSGASAFDNVAVERLFDKRYTPVINFTHDGANDGTVNIELTHPKLISRVVFAGSFGVGTTITVNDIELDPTLVFTVAEIADHGIDSGNFEPIMARNIVLVLPATSVLEEAIILKCVEVKQANLASVEIAAASIDVPTELQDIIEKAEDVYAQSVNAGPVIIIADCGGYKLKHIRCECTNGGAPATCVFEIELSWDNGVHWYPHYLSAPAETLHEETTELGSRWVRVTAQATGVAGDVVDLIVGSMP